MQRIVPGIMAVILSPSKAEILLHLRSDNFLWSVPGGSAEFGESIATLATREVFEETGIVVEIVRAFGIYSSPAEFVFRYADGNEVHSYVLGLECRKVGGTERADGLESQEVRWFPVADLPTNLMTMQRAVIRDALDARGFVIR